MLEALLVEEGMEINCPSLESALPVLSHGFQTINCLTSLQGLLMNILEWNNNFKKIGLHSLSSLIKLLIEGPISVAEDEEEDDVTGSSFPIDGKLLPTSLISLSIMKFRNLEKLSSKLFQNLTSLEEFYIKGSPRLKSLPVQRLPPLLKRLSISGSRKLTGKCEMGKGKYWPHISNIPKVKGSSFASIGNLQSMNSIEDSLPGIFDQHHSANRSNRGSSSASIGNLQSLNSIDNSLPENFNQIHDQEEWEKYRKWATTCVAMYASYAVSLVSILHCRDHIRKSISEQGDYERYVLIKRLTTLGDTNCRSQLCMSKDAFATLVSMLKRTQFLRDNPQSKVEEQVDCVGAIDGTDFHVRVPNKDAQRYRGRKCYPIQNALAACSFDLKFTYILSGWEGSTSDSRILDNALTIEMDKLINEEGSQECSVEIDKKHLKWNNQMDVVLIDSLLDQMLKGQKIGASFTSSAYRAASNAVSTKFSIHCDSNHVRNRLKTLKRSLAMAKDMLTTDSGFGYNHSTQLIEATAGVGNLPQGPKEKRLHWAGQQILLDDENTDKTKSLSENFDGIGTQDDQTAEVSCSSNSKKRKNKSSDTLSKEIMSIKDGLDAVAAALDHGILRNYTNGKLFEEIEKVSGMSDDSRMKVYQVLAKEVSDARAYLECPIEC
ncbi:unnamed protein product [Camellia sinensis]